MIGHHNFRTALCLTLAALLAMLAACDSGPGTDPATTPSQGDSAASATDAVTPAAQLRNQSGDKRAVVAETLAYAEVDEELVKGHFVFPEDMVDPLPAILLIHEWWGLDDQTRALADRFASEGFIVLAVDLYSGRVASSPATARNLMLNVVENPARATDNIAKALEWIFTTTGATEVATVGYGFGGGWSLHAAMNTPDKLDAAVILYGQVSTDEEALSRIAVPVLGFFGADDSAVLADSVLRFEEILKNLGKDYDIELFPGAKGGFASPGSHNFNVDLEREAWSRMIAFLHEKLVPAAKK